MKLTRRELIEHLRNIACAMGGYQILPLATSPLQAQAASASDEHFFIFVEIRGGIHHLISTDYPDPNKLNNIDRDGSNGIVMRIAPKDKKGFYNDPDLHPNFQNIFNKDTIDQFSNKAPFLPNGRFIILPYREKIEDGFLVGTTQQGKYQYRLGLGGLPLADCANDISVLRGVYMLGDFHTLAGVEIFSGRNSKNGKHVAGILAKVLEDRYGKKLLDNLVFENAYYPQDTERRSKIETKLSFQLLGTLASYYSNASSNDVDMTIISRALQKNLPFSTSQNNIMDKYISAMQEIGIMKERIKFLAAKDTDISLDLGMQLNTCLELFKSNISRVITICMGSKNNTNNADQFGLFDSHRGLYHQIDGKAAGSSRHHLTLERTMQDLANFVNKLKTTEYKNGKTWSEVVTLVLSSEFSRPTNLIGNESTDEVGAFGNGHYNFNNNYIFFGKNVKRGVWLGESDPITRFPYVVDFAKLNQGESSDKVFTNTVAETQGGQMKMMGYFQGTDTLNPNMNASQGGMQVPRQKDNPEQRAFMSKDVVKTIMAIAGVDSDEFHQQHYSDDSYKDAKIIAPLLP